MAKPSSASPSVRHFPASGWEASPGQIVFFQDAGRRFELLRRLLHELSGVLLLQATAARADVHIRDVESLVRRDLEEAGEVRTATPPGSCQLLYRELNRSLQHLRFANQEMLRSGSTESGVTAARKALVLAGDALCRASHRLPGAELIDHDSACCACARDPYHRRSRQAT